MASLIDERLLEGQTALNALSEAHCNILLEPLRDNESGVMADEVKRLRKAVETNALTSPWPRQLEETIGALWDQYTEGGVNMALDEVLGEIHEDESDDDDLDEQLYAEVKTVHGRLFHAMVQHAGIRPPRS